MIRQIEIENFKCFKRSRIPFAPMTIISGGNGVGKSSIIQALLLIRQASDQLRQIEGFAELPLSDTLDFPVKLNGAYRLALGNSMTVTNSEIESAELKLGLGSDNLLSGQLLQLTFFADTVPTVSDAVVPS